MTRMTPLLLVPAICALSACNNMPQAPNNTAAEDVNTSGTADMNATAAAGAIDNAFLTDAIKADTGEIQLGDLAQAKGTSKGLKDFGQTLVTDHGKAKDQASTLAEQADMPIPGEPKDEQKTELQKLQGLSGAAFDKEFLRFAIEAHKKDIAKFQEEANGTGPAADLAKQQLPTLQKHLDIAQGLQGK